MTKPNGSLFQRDCGILLHPTSLPNSFGIGDFGSSAHRWINELSNRGQSLWQILPLNPAGYGDSPYQGLSAFAANPIFLSPESIHELGLIDSEELLSLELPVGPSVDYEKVYANKLNLSKWAAKNFFALEDENPLRREYELFVHREEKWIEDFALFSALKFNLGGEAWTSWPEDFRDRDSKTMRVAARDFAPDIQRIKMEQFLLRRQWNAVREHAHAQGIRIIGDLPIFVAHDSADVWCRRDLFRLDAEGTPEVVAGVPPDYFSKTGQLWGNPLYNWTKHREDHFAWWRRRLRTTLTWVDVVRIDHFRGFESCWEVPGDAQTAMDGRWIPAPGEEVFERFVEDWGIPLPVIAEDLGVITPEVVALRDLFQLPGIRVMQFAFGNDPMKNTFLPDSYDQNCVAYTGTHDNDTVVGWFNSVAENGSTRSAEEIDTERKNALDYFGGDGSAIHQDFIRSLYRSECAAAIVPVQDVLGLDSDARMNTPGLSSGSWQWRLSDYETLSSAMNDLQTCTTECRRGQFSESHASMGSTASG